MKRLTLSNARDLIKRELGISATSLIAPPEMNGNQEYPWYGMTSGTMLIEVHTEDFNQGKFTDKMIALRVTHENSSKGTTEYFYGDTLEYSAPYTDWQNREAFCENMEDPQSDTRLRRLKREAQDDCWQHFHGQKILKVDKQEPTLWEPCKLKICFFGPNGTYFKETEPFHSMFLGAQVRKAVQEVLGEHVRNDLREVKDIKTAGFSVFQWNEKIECWVDYAPCGRAITYDTGLRSDGIIYKALQQNINISGENLNKLKDRLKSAKEEADAKEMKAPDRGHSDMML